MGAVARKVEVAPHSCGGCGRMLPPEAPGCLACVLAERAAIGRRRAEQAAVAERAHLRVVR